MEGEKCGPSDTELSSVYHPSDRDLSFSILGDDSDSLMDMTCVSTNHFAARDVNREDYCTLNSWPSSSR